MVFAFMLSARDNWWNFLLTWPPQAAVLVIMLFIGARAAAITGATLAFAVHLGTFDGWIDTRYPNDDQVWFLYWLSFPGGLLAAAGVAGRINDQDDRSALEAGLIGAAAVIVGIFINHQLSKHFFLSFLLSMGRI